MKSQQKTSLSDVIWVVFLIGSILVILAFDSRDAIASGLQTLQSAFVTSPTAVAGASVEGFTFAPALISFVVVLTVGYLLVGRKTHSQSVDAPSAKTPKFIEVKIIR